MTGQDFAKLFVIEGIGQVLATIEYDNDDDVDRLRFRIPDCEGCELSMGIGLPAGADPENAEAFVRKLFDGLTDEGVADFVQPLVQARDRILKVN